MLISIFSIVYDIIVMTFSAGVGFMGTRLVANVQGGFIDPWLYVP